MARFPPNLLLYPEAHLNGAGVAVVPHLTVRLEHRCARLWNLVFVLSVGEYFALSDEAAPILDEVLSVLDRVMVVCGPVDHATPQFRGLLSSAQAQLWHLLALPCGSDDRLTLVDVQCEIQALLSETAP